MPAIARDHAGEHRSGDAGEAGHVRVDHRFPIAPLRLVGLAEPQREARAVEEDVDRLKIDREPVERGRDLRVAADVHGAHHQPIRFHLRRELLQALRPAAGRDDPSARTEEAPR